MIYLYGIARPAAALSDATGQASPTLCGIEGDRVQLIPLPPLESATHGMPVALVGLVRSAPAATAAHLVEHDRVCTTALVRGCDVLPARFGQLFTDAAALSNEYLQRASLLGPLWQRVENAVEMSLTIRAGDAAATAAASDPRAVRAQSAHASVDPFGAGHGPEASSTGMGYAYLNRIAGPIRERQRARERIEPFRADLRQSAGDLIHGEVVRSQSVADVMGLSHLIDRAAIAAYGRVVGEVAVAHPLIRVLFLGPSAPYSFVSLDRALPTSSDADAAHR